MKGEHPIWKVGLFEKLTKEEAHCIQCKKEGKPKHAFKLGKGSVKSLTTHLNSELHASAYGE